MQLLALGNLSNHSATLYPTAELTPVAGGRPQASFFSSFFLSHLLAADINNVNDAS